MTLKPFVVVVLTAQVKRNWPGCVMTHAASALPGMPRSEDQPVTSAVDANRKLRNRARLSTATLVVHAQSSQDQTFSVSSPFELTAAPDPAVPLRTPCAFHPALRLILRVRPTVRFTGGFQASATDAQVEITENQRLVLLEQQNYT